MNKNRRWNWPLNKSPTRDERCRRQQFDTGDDDDPVFISGSRPDGRGRATPTVYHENPDCWQLHNNGCVVPREVTRIGAKHRWLAPCAVCVLPSDFRDPTLSED